MTLQKLNPAPIPLIALKKGAFNAVGRLKVIIAIVDIETNGRTKI
jgi:hypothetical protein